MSDAGAPVPLPAVVGVLGGGRMGAGIAHAFLIRGAAVRVVERDREAADAASARIADAVAASAARGALQATPAAVLANLSTGTDALSLTGCGLVVEAIPENLDHKVAALTAAEKVLDPDAVLASNTSSLSITALAGRLDRPANFLGLHFFNPVPASALIEVVVTGKTPPDLVARATGWADALGKTAVVVHDTPGFASSRLGVALALEAMRMLEEGVASAADIDSAMVLGYRHPTGPLRTTDIVGLDVRLAIAEYLHANLGDRFAPPDILRTKVANGDLGRKTGRGFFDWPREEAVH
jgi:3-hydroxybutyryl-CoA dehydrogenase